jgi:hypothetical protein
MRNEMVNMGKVLHLLTLTNLRHFAFLLCAVMFSAPVQLASVAPSRKGSVLVGNGAFQHSRPTFKNSPSSRKEVELPYEPYCY